MELLVCIKQVPDDSVTVTLDTATGGPQLKDVTPVVNAFDTYALEMATRFKEANGGSVTVVTIGDEAALTPSLRSCLSVGAEHAYVVTEPAAVSALGKSYLLGKAAGKLAEGPFDVIFCGCESTDTADGQAGVQLAEQLGLPVITNVLELEPKDGGISAKQETEEGYRLKTKPFGIDEYRAGAFPIGNQKPLLTESFGLLVQGNFGRRTEPFSDCKGSNREMPGMRFRCI